MRVHRDTGRDASALQGSEKSSMAMLLRRNPTFLHLRSLLLSSSGVNRAFFFITWLRLSAGVWSNSKTKDIGHVEFEQFADGTVIVQ